VHPDAVWDGKWGRSGMGVVTIEEERVVLGFNLGRLIVTNGASHCIIYIDIAPKSTSESMAH